MLTTSIDCISEASKLAEFLEVIQKVRELAGRHLRYKELRPSIEIVKHTVIIAAIHQEFPTDEELQWRIPAEEEMRMDLKDINYAIPTDDRDPDSIDIIKEEEKLNQSFDITMEDISDIPRLLRDLDVDSESLGLKQGVVWLDLVDGEFGTRRFKRSQTWLYNSHQVNELTHGGLLLATLINKRYPERKVIWTDVLNQARFTERALHELHLLFAQMRDIDNSYLDGYDLRAISDESSEIDVELNESVERSEVVE